MRTMAVVDYIILDIVVKLCQQYLLTVYEVNVNDATFCQLWDIRSEFIGVLFSRINEEQEIANAANHQYFNQQLVDINKLAIIGSKALPKAYAEWFASPPPQKIWINFKQFCLEKYPMQQTVYEITRQLEYNGANLAEWAIMRTSS